MDRNTSLQLFEYIKCQKEGRDYTGALNEEARFIIGRVGSKNLDDLEKEAEALYVFDHVL